MGKVDITGKGKFTITYGGLESPMSGIDSTHQTGLYIQPQSLAAAGGIMSQDGYLNSIFLNPRSEINIGNVQPTAYVIGDVQVFSAVAVTDGSQKQVTISKASWGFLVLSVGTTLTVLEFRNGFIASASSTSISIAANPAINLTWYTVNGVVYITGLGLGAIYAYTPNFSGASTLTQLTNYVGGAYLGELNGRLICLCCDSFQTGSYVYNPYLISWSAGSGNYSQWNPLVSGLVTGAGFNQLPDVSDEITGFFTVGPTGYIIRKQGISEMTPLNSGIQPFDFNHMWASNKGVGSVYPNSVTQYGSLGGFLSDTGIFTLGYGGINEIQGLFWAEINRLLDVLFASTSGSQFTQVLQAVVAGLVPLYINNERKLAYVLYIPTSEGLLFVGDVLTQQWNSVSCFPQIGFSLPAIRAISYAAMYLQGADQSISCVSVLRELSSLNYVIDLFTIDDTLMLPVQVNPPPFVDSTPFATFPIEEVLMNRDITIDAVALTADADVVNNDKVVIGITLLHPTLKGSVPVNYTEIDVNQQAQYGKSFPTTPSPLSSGNNIVTHRYPQLQLNISMGTLGPSSVRIYKVVMYCSFDQDQAP